MFSTVIFAGPSLSSSSRNLLDENCQSTIKLLSPAKSGSIWQLSGSYQSLQRIIIADGYFYDTLSVLHREICDAINSGISVIGCSSMGALRAVELKSCGMIGFGVVFNFIQQNPWLPDDEVALVHENSATYIAYSIPIVNFRILSSQLSHSNPEYSQILALLATELSTFQFERRTWKLVEKICHTLPLSIDPTTFFKLLRTTLYKDFKKDDTDTLIKQLLLDSTLFQKELSIPISSCVSPSFSDPPHDFGIDSCFLQAKGLEASPNSKNNFSVQHAISSLRLQGFFEPSDIARCIHKYQISSLYPSLEVPLPITEELTRSLFHKYNCTSIQDLSFATGLSVGKLKKAIKDESIFAYYLKIKSDEIGNILLNDLLYLDIITHSSNLVSPAHIEQIQVQTDFVSTSNSIAQSVDLVSGLRFLCVLMGINIKQLLRYASSTRFRDIITLLSFMLERK